MNEFTLFFVGHRPQSNLPDNSVVVWPVNPGWNDFGFGFQAKGRITGASLPAVARPSVDIDLFVVPWPLSGQRRFNTWIEPFLPDGNQLWPATSLPAGQNFFSLMKSEGDYRSVVQFAGGDAGMLGRVLRPLRDAAYCRRNLLEREQLQVFLADDAVVKGLFRHESAYLAWHRGGSILAGEQLHLTSDAREPFAFSTRLPGFHASHRLAVRFGLPAPLKDRCHALIGRNGSGKSRLLRELILTIGSLTDGTSTSPFIDNSEVTGVETELTPPGLRFSRVLALSWDSRSSFPEMARLDTPFQYLHFKMLEDHHPSEETSESESLTSMLIQMFRSKSLSSDPPFERLREAL